MDTLSVAVRITEDGQIPVPEQLRQDLGLSPQQEVRLYTRGRELVVQPVTDDTSRQKQIEAILRRAKLRAAVLSEDLTDKEAWAIYDQAASALGQAVRETLPES